MRLSRRWELCVLLAYVFYGTILGFSFVGCSKRRRFTSRDYLQGTSQHRHQRPSIARAAVGVAKKSDSEPKSSDTTSRSLAVRAIMTASNKRKHVEKNNIADRLESLTGYQGLSLRDRAFCRLLVVTVERRQGQIDAVLEECLKRPKTAQRLQQRSSRAEQLLQAALQVGCAQILFLDVPPHAAVKETVDTLDLIISSLSRKHVGFVNAVLRRIVRERGTLLDRYGARVELNAAPWVVRALTDNWGEQAMYRILDSSMKESPRVLTVNLKRAVQEMGSPNENAAVEDVAKQFDDAEILPQGSIRVRESGPVSLWPLYESGVWWCQDPSATIPALAVRSALQGVKHPTVIDLCAAPGGKTAQLASFGMDVTAVEVSKQRCRRLESNRQRTGLDWELVVADGTKWIPENLVDGVLIDAPCSATGTGSKRPDVLRRDQEMTELLDVQYRLANHAAHHVVRVGGILVYATCSLLKQESEDQVAKLLESNRGTIETAGFLAGEIPGFDEAITEEGWIRVLPGSLTEIGPCDGFFVARLRRTA